MSYFNGLGTEGAVQDIQRLRQIFTSQYHPFLDTLDAAVYPTIANRGGNAQERWNPLTLFGKKDAARWNESQYISHDIEHMLNSYQQRMMRSPVKIDVDAMPKDKREGLQQGIVEDYCHGMLQHVTTNVQDAAEAQSHIARMAMWAGRYGKVCQFVDIKQDEDGVWRFIWDFYHPRCVYHDFGSLPRVFVYEAWYSMPQARYKLEQAYGDGGYRMPSKLDGKKKPGELVRLSDLWVEERKGKRTVISNQCFVEDEPVVEPMETEYSRRPFHVIAMTGQGASFQATTMNGSSHEQPFQALMDHARPFYASIIDNIRMSDDFHSMEATAMALGINPPVEVIEERRGSAKGIEDQTIGPGTKIIHDREITIKAMEFLSRQLNNFTTPDDLKEERRHVYSDALWGATASSNESNILYASRIDEAENAIVAPTLVMATAYQRGLETLLHLSRDKGVTIQMSVEATKGKSQGKEHMIDFDAKRDIPAAFGLKVTLPPMLPRDSLKNVQIYQLAVTSGMYDEEFAMREIGKLADPQAVIERREMDRVRNSEPAQRLRDIRIAREEAKALEFRAMRATDPAERAALLKEANWAKLAAQQLSATYLGQAPSFQMQPEAGTPAPAEQPPEERGMESPPLQRAMMGVPNPGGRPKALQKGAA